MIVNIKNELAALDRNDFDMGMNLIEDYLYDLINPDLLDFNSSDS